eukprot:scpid51546/ scgid23825/ FERM domain-containing protein 4A
MPPHDIGRKCMIILLDDSKIDTYLHFSLTGAELVDLVATQFHLKEKEYFGLCLDGSENAPQWLELDRPVLEQDIPAQGVLWLRFQVRYYVESVAWLKDSVAVEMFYLQCKQNVFRDLTVCSSETVFQLAAFVMQATYGDFNMHQVAKEDLKRLPVIPASTLKEHPDTNFCESEIIHIYEYLQSKSRGIAILSYLNTVIMQPTFGLHCYEVRDKSDQPYLLGLSPKGLGVYEPSNRSVLLELFEWKNLENIYHRDKKFSIEVYQQATSQTSQGQAKPGSAGNVGPSQLARGVVPRNLVVHVWFSSNPRLLRSLFNTAKGQHQLYLSKRATRAASPSQCRSPSQLAQELSLSTMSLDSASNLTGSTNSLVSTGSKGTATTTAVSEENQAAAQAAARIAEREMYLALIARRDALRQKLTRHEEELRQLGREEERLRNQRSRKPVENNPRIASASYKFSDSVVNTSQSPSVRKNQIEEARKDLQIQQTIVNAATKLYQERGLSRNVRKERKESMKKNLDKLRDAQARLDFLLSQQSEASLSLDSGLNESRDPRASSPAVHGLPTSAPSTVNQSPTPSSEDGRPRDHFNSQADEDFVASLIAGDLQPRSAPSMAKASHPAAPPAAASSPNSSGVVAAAAAAARSTSQARGHHASAAPPGPSNLTLRQQPSPVGPSPSIVPLARERLKSLAQKRQSFLMEDPVAPVNGYPSRPDSSSSEDESGRPRRGREVLSWLDDQQLFGQGTLV